MWGFVTQQHITRMVSEILTKLIHFYFHFFLPSKFDAKCRPCLCSSSLLNVAGGFHHVRYRPVVIEVKFMHHVLSVLNDSNLQVRREGNDPESYPFGGEASWSQLLSVTVEE